MTGIVCRADGERWRRDIDGDADKFVSFPTHQEAMDYIRKSLETRPHLECHLYKDEEYIDVFQPPYPAAETDSAASRNPPKRVSLKMPDGTLLFLLVIVVLVALVAFCALVL
jgi:hypothetical protein